LDQALADWRQAGGTAATITYAGTPALVRQIEQGLPADLFFSADSDWMDHLAGRGGLRPQTRRDLLGNRLVLIARPGVETVLPPEVRSSGVELGKGDTADRALRAALGNGPGRTRLALAEVGSVPAGRYARAALEALNLWQPWSSRLAMTDNVRAALLLVARGETDLGIVYASDAQLEPRIRVVATFADSLHPPIRYPAAVLASATHPRALEALEFLAQPAAIKRFLEAGFTAPGPAARP
jgi:molybdate transport system substrate-binding protein